jgi:hypothetical protein
MEEWGRKYMLMVLLNVLVAGSHPCCCLPCPELVFIKIM